jgi:hypothetical protein
VLDVCEHDLQPLEALGDARLSGVLQAMALLRAEIVAALATVTPDQLTALASSCPRIGRGAGGGHPV